MLGDLLIKYEEITGIICEIEKSSQETGKEESLVAAKNASKSKVTDIYGENTMMSKYYTYWEMCILNALTKTILKAIITLYELFSMPRQENNTNVLFTIKSKFVSSKEIMYNPNPEEIDHILKNKLILNFQNSGNDFIRWMSGTCKAPDISNLVEEKSELIRARYSYGYETNQNDDVKYYVQRLYEIVQNIGKNLANNKQKYTREYAVNKFGNWSQSQSIMEIALSKVGSLKNFEIKLSESASYLEEFKKKFHVTRNCDGNIVINNEELINKGIDQLYRVMIEMLKILAKQLEEIDIKNFTEQIEVNKGKLREPIKDSEFFKVVLDYISKIKSKKLNMKLKINDIGEKIHFLELHNYPFQSDIMVKFDMMLKNIIQSYEVIQKEWYNLLVKAQTKDDKLKVKKDILKKSTIEDVEALKKEVDVIYTEYKEFGPASDKIDLSTGFNKLMEYKGKLEEIVQKKKKHSSLPEALRYAYDPILFNF